MAKSNNSEKTAEDQIRYVMLCNPYDFGHSWTHDQVLDHCLTIANPTENQQSKANNDYEEEELKKMKELIEKKIEACQTVQEFQTLKIQYEVLLGDINKKLQLTTEERSDFDNVFVNAVPLSIYNPNNEAAYSLANVYSSVQGGFDGTNGLCDIGANSKSGGHDETSNFQSQLPVPKLFVYNKVGGSGF